MSLFIVKVFYELEQYNVEFLEETNKNFKNFLFSSSKFKVLYLYCILAYLRLSSVRSIFLILLDKSNLRVC